MPAATVGILLVDMDKAWLSIGLQRRIAYLGDLQNGLTWPVIPALREA